MTRAEAIEAAARGLTYFGQTVDGFVMVGPVGWDQLRAALALPPDPPPTCTACEREAAPDPPKPGERCPCCGREAA